MSILIVEDDPVTLLTINKILIKNEYETLTAKSVKEAIAILESKSSIKLIISDIMMPEADGFELLKFRQSFLRLREIPVLLCSALGDSGSVTKGISMGANDYLVKPIQKEILLKKIKNLLGSAVKTILLVDDEELMLNVLSNIIERQGYKSIKAKSAEEALEVMKSSYIDLIISDIVLPQMNGLELLVTIKEKNSNIPIILITGHSGKYKKVDAIAAGADEYFAKPFRNIEILRKISSLINQPAHKV